MRLHLALSALLVTAIPMAGRAETPKPLNYVVLGDSTASGVGADYEAGIAACTERERSSLAHVDPTRGRGKGTPRARVLLVDDPTAVSLRPDVVLLSAGANDVTHLTLIRSMRADLRAIVNELRAANPDVKIVITGSPDMGSPPRIPRVLRGIASLRTKQVNEMFEEEARQNSLVFAPIATTTGPLFREDRSLFAADEFHPNERGYATWVPVLNEALATATH